MRKVLGVLAAMALCSCSNEWSAGLADKRAGSPVGSPSSMSMDQAAAASAALRAAGHRSFANAPDKGSLVQYPDDQVIRRTGAYTWHAAALSEDHALRSTITGNLSFTAPDGTPINLAYERRVEHPDGNWSWIGRAEGERGESTVITFGEEAVFGTIPQARDQPPLRLTVSDGRTWVVSADPRLLREIRNEATHPTDQDFLVPPKLAASTATALGGIEALGAEAMAATASGKTVVDVMVGFTNGYATYRGGASAAITRIHNLVEVTNQAYRNSQVDAEVRLVHSMQISYPDATANKTALEELTGFKAPSTRTTPAPAFSALRSARDQYGADVVVLLRRFQDPENDGCGIAWLIGGGQSGINASDEFFGYSVVGDGQDVGTDGKTYFCREETLAHELGHNMGVQHDRASATVDGSLNYGVHQYSFGYKTAAGGGDFYTVMANGDTGQTSFRTFSNPRSTFCGLPCGIDNEADSARSLGQTIPIIASFRNQVVPVHSHVRHDIDGDGKSDLLFRYYRTAPNNLNYWIMNGAGRVRTGADSMGVSYRIVATGDFNGDGKLDIVWAADSIRKLTMWLGNGTSFAKHELGSYGLGWSVAGAGDIDGDGKSDLLFRYYKTAPNNLVYWIMNGKTRVRTGAATMGASYKIAATGDFNGDGKLDIVWAADSVRKLFMWMGNGTSFSSASVGTYGLGWSVAGAGDVDGDGKSDLMFRYYKTAPNNYVYWIMNGTSRVRQGSGSMGASYRIATTGDYNGDGKVDIIWSADSIRRLYMSTGTGTTFRLLATYGLGWSVVGS